MESSVPKVTAVLARILATAAVVAAATVASAQETERYDRGDPEALMEDEIVPLAERLTPLLRQVVRGRDGRAMPIQLLSAPIVPTDPDGPLRAHFHCPWGASDCAQFLQACVSLQLSCSCSDYGSIDPDPC